MSRPLQRNASDRGQVKYAERKARDRERRFLDALGAVMRSPAGRIVMWELFGWARLDESVYDHSGSMMYFREGARNLGLRLKAAVLEADEDAYQVMEHEMRAWQKGQDRETAATQQAPRAVEGETTDD